MGEGETVVLANRTPNVQAVGVRMMNTDKPTTKASAPETRTLDKRKKVYCARCGEESGGRGTSFWTHVHKWGPTTHKFKPTNERKS